MRCTFNKKCNPSFSVIFFFLVFQNALFAQQKNLLINSGELIKKGNELHDKKLYKQAIETYKQISRSDTSYADALYELSMSCYSDSQLVEAHKYAMLGLKLFPEQFPRYSMQAANALDDMGKTEEAIKMYDEALAKDPQSYILYFNKAITLMNAENDIDAKTNFEKCLLINPYYASAHYFIGTIYMRQGNLVPAMLAFKSYLLFAPSGKYLKTTITKLSAISNATDEILNSVKTKKTSSEDNFEMLQQIVLSKIALDKQYELKAKLEDPIVRQLQVIDEKLIYKGGDKGFAMQFYVPIYSKFFKEDDFEPLIFSIFSGTEIKTVDTWVKKNKKPIEIFAAKAVTYFNEIRTTRILQETDRKNTVVKYYFENGEYQGKGNYTSDEKSVKMTKEWEFYYPTNGLLKAKGSFGAPDEKIGEWKYYYNTGILKQTANFKNGKLNGLLENWFTNGVKSSTTNYLDDKINGVETNYYYNGLLLRTTNYKEDKKNGIEKEYNSKGQLLFTANYVDDEKNGLVTYYYYNGKKQDELLYTKGKAEGLYKSYYKDGKKMTEGAYINDKKEGLWTTYYNNGNIKEKTTYKEDEITGEFTEYFEDGKLETKGNYFKKKIDGKIENYSEGGKICNDITYEKGRLKEINFYDSKGNIISSTSTRKGAADITFYSSEGIKISSGIFNKEGSKDGVYTEFYASGKVSSKTNYKDGLREGEQILYYANGKKSAENMYKDDLENGNTFSYYYDGKKKYDGWVIDNDKQQDFIFYTAKGDLKNKDYYNDNELSGYSEYFYPGNIKDCDYKYNNGWLEEVLQYDTTGKELSKSVFEKGKGPIVFKHYNGKKYAEGNYDHYMLNGIYKAYYFDGSSQSVAYYKNGELDSVYKSYYYGGQLQMQGKYVDGDKEGVWTYYYENGKVSEEEIFKEGQLTGQNKTYKRNGNIENIGNYLENQLDGEYQYFGENNELALVLNYKKGEVKSYTYEDKTGNRVTPIILKGSSGAIISFYKNGSSSASFNFVNNDIEGARKLFYTNGKTFVEGYREFGYDNGIRKVYHPNGTLWKEEQYELGNKNGLCKTYYSNGKIEIEENYYNNDLHGTCKYYDELGKLKQTRTYFYDILQTAK